MLIKRWEEQKRKYLPSICKGETISAVAVTEPDAGSDVLCVSTKAEKKGNGYLINGLKMFIFNGDVANIMVTLCLTHPGSTSPTERRSGIIVETDCLHAAYCRATVKRDFTSRDAIHSGSSHTV